MTAGDDERSPEQLRQELADLRRRVAQLEETLASLHRVKATNDAALNYAEGIIETVREPFLVLDGDLKILSANRSFYDCFRVRPDETLGLSVYDLGNGQWNIPELRTVLEKVISEGAVVENFEVAHSFQGIGRKVMLLNTRRIDRGSRGTPAVLLAIEDITDRKRTEDGLIQAAITDALTGLHNRRGLLALADQLVKSFRRDRKGFQLLLIDVDGLKLINDRLGHEAGDRALVDVAEILRATFRDSDIIARIGGDEFVVLPVGTTGETSEAVLARLQRTVDARNHESGRPYALSFSAGIARAEPGSDRSLALLLGDADAAMYLEKRRRHAR